MDNIENDDKTLSISTKTEIENYIKDKTIIEFKIPFSTLEDTLKIFEAMGCGYDQIKIVAYYSLASKGIYLLAKNGNIGIELKESDKNRDDALTIKPYKK